MHPAPSVIFFTVFSGAGFGLLAFLGFGAPDVSGWVAFVFYLIAYAMAVGGLVASTFHLGNPQRALKAFTQWRSSWLSREGWLAVLALVVMGLHALAVIFFDTRIAPLGWIGAALSVAAVYATSMIYGQLKTVPRWNHPLTSVYFLAFALTAGALLSGQVSLAIWLLVASGLIQIAYWFQGDKQFEAHGHTIETATGLGSRGAVRLLESPHSGSNYLLKEMAFVIGRKHALKLRMISFLLLIILPIFLLLGMGANHAFAALAVLSHLAGAVVSRWLFFAEAEHVVGLYYDKH
ncbi:dimethyl sulfoxide reductase anchor subunit family protein [Aliiroseovarius sp. YM-037]|uniref:dimethyl sulfoxide reductase anchor subunit family protein n=1 Tax=Aliiroseovarius sp. YM-037 TaxID=3341728 RepID=UPI003A7FDE56